MLQTIELLKEQTCHRSITESIASQQLMVQPPERSDMKVDTTDSEIAESRLRPSDDIAPQQMMFGLAMEEVQHLAVHFFQAATCIMDVPKRRILYTGVIVNFWKIGDYSIIFWQYLSLNIIGVNMD